MRFNIFNDSFDNFRGDSETDSEKSCCWVGVVLFVYPADGWSLVIVGVGVLLFSVNCWV